MSDCAPGTFEPEGSPWIETPRRGCADCRLCCDFPAAFPGGCGECACVPGVPVDCLEERVKFYAEQRMPVDVRPWRCELDLTRVGVSEPGCPCNPRRSTVFGRCPAGWRCAPFPAARGILWASQNSTDHLCAPCLVGEHCPLGTVGLDPAPCPEGAFCRTADSVETCPTGSFCPPRSEAPLTCDLHRLLSTRPWQEVPGPTVAEAIVAQARPLSGNACPESSGDPFGFCADGSACGSGGAPGPCPIGMRCPAGRPPAPCPYLTFCGSASFALLLWAAACAVAYVAFRWAERRHRRGLRPTEPGEHNFGYESDASTAVDVHFAGVGFELHDGRRICEGISGVFRAGTLNAILGPSGCGKTTVLALLRGKRMPFGTSYGTVCYGGVPRACHVPQDDLLYSTLTVQEHVYFSSALRVSRDPRTSTRLVDAVIRTLDLDGVAHTLVGSVRNKTLSGGQRKRVSVAMELVTVPNVVFMDEPTSGLDAAGAASLVHVLQNIRGVTFVCVVHQPRASVFMTFDSVMLLSPVGECVYLGPPGDVADAFDRCGVLLDPRENPADAAIDVLAQDPGLCQVMRAAHAQGMYLPRGALGRSEVLRPSVFWQTCHATRRCALLRCREALTSTALDCAALTVAGLLVALTQGSYWPPGVFSQKFTMAAVVPSVLMSVAFSRTLTNDSLMADRETDGGVRHAARLLSAFSVDLPFVLGYPMFFAAPLWSITLPAQALHHLWGVLVALAWACSGVSYSLSAAAPVYGVTLTCAFWALVTGVFLSGVQPPLPELHPGVSWITALSPARWAVEAGTMLEAMSLPADERLPAYLAMRRLGMCGLSPDDARPTRADLRWTPDDCAGNVATAIAVLGAIGLAGRLCAAAIVASQTLTTEWTYKARSWLVSATQQRRRFPFLRP